MSPLACGIGVDCVVQLPFLGLISIGAIVKMQFRMNWLTWLVVIIVAGIASRTVQPGWIVVDKYLGDALYAAMVYVLLSLQWQAAPLRKGGASMVLMTALEFFQLTRIPAHLLTKDNVILRTIARLLGTEFSFLDLLAYSIGIAMIGLLEFAAAKSWSKGPSSMLE